MAIILKVFNSIINFEKNTNSIIIVPPKHFNLNIENLNDKEIKETFFVGFDLKTTNILTSKKLLTLKNSLNSNLGFCIIHTLIEKMEKYNYFFINPVGVDTTGVNSLINFIQSIENRDQRFFIFITKKSIKNVNSKKSLPIIISKFDSKIIKEIEFKLKGK